MVDGWGGRRKRSSPFTWELHCQLRARIPGIHPAGASDLESNQSPGTPTARISWTGGCSPGSDRIKLRSWIKKIPFGPLERALSHFSLSPGRHLAALPNLRVEEQLGGLYSLMQLMQRLVCAQVSSTGANPMRQKKPNKRRGRNNRGSKAEMGSINIQVHLGLTNWPAAEARFKTGMI
jgi:hypothetical protein